MEKEIKTARRTGDGWRPENECGLLRNTQESLSREPTHPEEEVGVGGGRHSLQKNRCKGFSASYFCILLIFQLSKADCPKQHSEELACSFLEACLAQSLCLQLPCILLTGDGPLIEPCFIWYQQKRQTNQLTDPS